MSEDKVVPFRPKDEIDDPLTEILRAITKRADPRYIPSECLVHVIRASRRDNNEAWFEPCLSG
jgi:hypothetical protein